jgi:hypothetical protein
MYVCQGRISGEGAFRNCEQHEEMEKDSLRFSSPAPLTWWKEVDFIFASCWRNIRFTRRYNESLLVSVSEGINRTNLPLSPVPNTYSSRKCVYSYFSSFPSTAKASAATTEKAKLSVMIMAHLHSFVIRSAYSADVCTLPCTLHEVGGKIVMGSWRNAGNGNRSSTLFRIRNILHRSAYAMVVGIEIAQYCQKEKCVYGKQIIHKFILCSAFREACPYLQETPCSCTQSMYFIGLVCNCKCI